MLLYFDSGNKQSNKQNCVPICLNVCNPSSSASNNIWWIPVKRHKNQHTCAV